VNSFLISSLNATFSRQQENLDDWHEFLTTEMVTGKFFSY